MKHYEQWALDYQMKLIEELENAPLGKERVLAKIRKNSNNKTWEAGFLFAIEAVLSGKFSNSDQIQEWAFGECKE